MYKITQLKYKQFVLKFMCLICNCLYAITTRYVVDDSQVNSQDYEGHVGDLYLSKCVWLLRC